MLLEIFADWLDIILLFQSQQHCCFVTLHQQYTIFNKSLTSFLTFFPPRLVTSRTSRTSRFVTSRTYFKVGYFTYFTYFKVGHFTYECKGERKYVSRDSRTELLKRKLEDKAENGKKKRVSGNAGGSFCKSNQKVHIII